MFLDIETSCFFYPQITQIARIFKGKQESFFLVSNTF